VRGCGVVVREVGVVVGWRIRSGSRGCGGGGSDDWWMEGSEKQRRSRGGGGEVAAGELGSSWGGRSQAAVRPGG
jgi:hypothetical protein